MKKVLAFDMGATSIRGIVGYQENGKFCTKEVMRMSHKIQNRDGRLYWDFNAIAKKVEDTILENPDVSAIGIDTWGVDFGVIDKEGNLLQAPHSYRDEKFAEGREEARALLDEFELFQNSGNQIMTINTVYQLLSLKKFDREIYDKADKILMMPDLLFYLLTGEKIGEESIWSTTGLYDLSKKQVSEHLFEKLKLNKELVPRIVRAGECKGNTKNSRLESLRALSIDVIPVLGHDTASALLMIEDTKDSLFLSCGTWSLIGTSVEDAKVSREVYEKNLTNELSYKSETLFFKNITGLYLLEKYKAELEERLGRKIPFQEITDFVKKEEESKSLLDMDAEVFGREGIAVKKEIDAFLLSRGGTVPKEDFSYFTLIYDSMVEKYREVKEDIEQILGRNFTKLHMIGGGARSEVLAEKIARKLKVRVKAGPYESSALGNILLLLLQEKEVGSIEEGRKLIYEASEVKDYS